MTWLDDALNTAEAGHEILTKCLVWTLVVVAVVLLSPALIPVLTIDYLIGRVFGKRKVTP